MYNKAFVVLFAALLMSIAGPAIVSADESTLVNGVVEGGIRTTGGDAKDSAQYQEFGTKDGKGFGSVQINLAAPKHYLIFESDYQGSDDMSFMLKGGQYGLYKYQVDYDQMPHNYYFNAITPATGMGTDFVDYPLLASVPDLDEWWKEWETFDYSVTHKSVGAEVEMSFNTPYYINISAQHRTADGLRPYSTRYFTEMGEPVDSTTDTVTAKLGYAADNISASLSGSISQFENENPFMRWSDPEDGDITEIVFSPDSELKKLAADFNWRNLPLNSVFSAGVSNSWLESDFDMNDVGFTDTGSYNRTDFEGDVEYKTASLSLLSRPINKLNTKLYYRYIDRDNDSSIIDYGTTNADELLSYDKNIYGVEVGYRLPMKTKLDVGYEYLKTERSTPSGDAIPTDDTRDDTVFVQLKNKYFDWMTAKLRYTYLDRESSDIGREVSSDTPTAFYYMDQTSDQVKLAFEFYPIEQLDLGLDFGYEKIDYDYAIDTRQDETNYSTYLDAVWRATDILALRGFVGIEKVEIEANRVDNNQPTPQRKEEVEEDFWTYGVGVDYQATSKLRFDVSWQYQDADGSVDFTSYVGDSYVDIDESDDYTKQQLEAKAIYSLTDAIALTLGFNYEKFNYDDRNFSNYPGNYLVDNGDDAILSGLYSDQDYEVSVAYLSMSYTF